MLGSNYTFILLWHKIIYTFLHVHCVLNSIGIEIAPNVWLHKSPHKWMKIIEIVHGPCAHLGLHDKIKCCKLKCVYLFSRVEIFIYKVWPPTSYPWHYLGQIATFCQMNKLLSCILIRFRDDPINSWGVKKTLLVFWFWPPSGQVVNMREPPLRKTWDILKYHQTSLISLDSISSRFNVLNMPISTTAPGDRR
jgi:hypothetical protein